MGLRFIVAAFGVLELLFPKRVIGAMMDVTTTGEPTAEFKPWVYTLARLEGLVLVLVAVWWTRDRTEET